MPSQFRQRARALLAIVPAQNQIQTFSLSIQKGTEKKKSKKNTKAHLNLLGRTQEN
jgi:hypothetical protein